MVSALASPRVRAGVLQLLVLGLVVAGGLAAVHVAAGNLARQGIASGFGFLHVTAGFDIIMHVIDYDEQSSYGAVFLVGLVNTLILASLVIVVSTVLGFAIGMARLSGNWLASRMAGAYVEIFRNIPVLLQIFFWYFAVLRALPGPRQSFELGAAIFLNNRGLYLPRPLIEPAALMLAGAAVIALMVIGWRARGRARSAAIGLAVLAVGLLAASADWDMPALQRFGYRGGLVLIPEFMAMVVALSVYTAAYVAEITRAGIEGVERGQVEAAKALGLTPRDRMAHVVLPQALRIIVPPLTSQYLDVVKNTTLATAIAFPDLMSVFGGTVLNQTGQAIEVLAMTMAVYLTVSLAISAAMNLYNARVKGPGR